MPDVYNQDEGRAEIDISETVIPSNWDYDVRRPSARRGRQRKNLGAMLVRFRSNKNQSYLMLLWSCRYILDPATSENPRKDFSEGFKSVWYKRHRHQEQDENEMKPEDIEKLLEQQTAEIKTIVSANSKWGTLWSPAAIVFTIVLALLAFYFTIIRDMKTFGDALTISQTKNNDNVNKQLMDFRKDVSQIQTTVDKGFSDIKAELSQFEVRLTSDVNKQLMDFRKDLSQSQQTILEQQIQKAQPTKQQ